MMALDNLIEGEVWRPVASFDGVFKDYYHVSNCCRVKSLDRWIKHWRGGKSLKRGRILTPLKAGNYLFVMLHSNGEYECIYIHQLVADTFPEICGLPFPGSELDHKNGNPHDNRPENLEYKTHKENMNNPITKERKRKKLSKPVMQYSKDGQFIAEYPSESEAERQTGVDRSKIGACCLGKRKSAGGFVWKFK